MEKYQGFLLACIMGEIKGFGGRFVGVLKSQD